MLNAGIERATSEQQGIDTGAHDQAAPFHALRLSRCPLFTSAGAISCAKATGGQPATQDTGPACQINSRQPDAERRGATETNDLLYDRFGDRAEVGQRF
jgi:hypothetical protein